MNELFKAPDILWQNAFNSMTDYISVHDNNHKIILANRTFTDLLGLESEDVIGKYCYQLIHKRSEPLMLCPHAQALSEKKPVKEIIHDYHDGNTHQVRCAPLVLESGEIAGTVHISQDIEEQMNTQQVLAELVTKLSEALHSTKQLTGLIPICASCKKIRNNQGHWAHLESYIEKNSGAKFSHGLCPDCKFKLYPELS